jgi:hypothetical protein
METLQNQLMEAIDTNRRNYMSESVDEEAVRWLERAQLRSVRRRVRDSDEAEQNFRATLADIDHRIATPDTIEITSEDMRAHAEFLRRRAAHAALKKCDVQLQAAVNQAYAKFNVAMAVALNSIITADDQVSSAGVQLQSPTQADEALSQDTANRDLLLNARMLLRLEGSNLSLRTAMCLRNENIICVADLVRRSAQDMLRTPNFGRKSLDEVEEILDALGLSLGMTIPGWPPDNVNRGI